MSWLMRGIQSAIFHYASCAPCTGYMYRKQRRRQAKKDRKTRKRLQLENPDDYHHPEPTGTNPYWSEEITMGPGPPPRRARKTTTSSQRGITTAGTHSTVVSQAGSSFDMDQADDMRLSNDTNDDDDDENWNRRRYQREDEDLWGFGDPATPTHLTVAGSSVGVTVTTRPSTSKSSAESYRTARVPPVNDLHPPVVSFPSSHPSDNRWMLQPPPRARVMSGKERATNRSRSASGASSRVELSLQRQVSARQLKHKLERGETPELPPISRGSSYSNLVAGQRHDRPKTPQPRPPSAASSRRQKRRDTKVMYTDPLDQSSGDSSDTILRRSSLQVSKVPNLKVVRVRSSRQPLSTVVSSGSGDPPPSTHVTLRSTSGSENNMPEMTTPTRRSAKYSSTHSSDSVPYLMKHRAPLASSDVSSLNVLQDLVSPRALLNSRFVSAPLMEARIKLPPSDMEEETVLNTSKEAAWAGSGSGFGISRGWGTDQIDGQARVPFDCLGPPERDPRMRWSVDF